MECCIPIVYFGVNDGDDDNEDDYDYDDVDDHRVLHTCNLAKAVCKCN